MVCVGIEALNNTDIVDILSYPTSCDLQFWAKILVAFFFVVAFILIKNDQERQPKADWISAFGISAMATIFLALAGTLVGFINNLVFIEILVGGLVFIVIWLFKK